MADSLTCDVRQEIAPDGTSIPVPVGGLGLPDGTSTEVGSDAQVTITESRNQDGELLGYYVVIDTAGEGGGEAGEIAAELAQETAITRLEQMAGEAFSTVAPYAFRAAGLVVGVLVTILTPSKLTREVFIRTSLDTGQSTDGPPITYCILTPSD